MVLTFKEVKNFDKNKANNVMLCFKPELPEINPKILDFIQSQYERDMIFNEKSKLRKSILNKENIMETYLFTTLQNVYGEAVINEVISAINCVLDAVDAVDRINYTIDTLEELKKIVK